MGSWSLLLRGCNPSRRAARQRLGLAYLEVERQAEDFTPADVARLRATGGLPEGFVDSVVQRVGSAESRRWLATPITLLVLLVIGGLHIWTAASAPDDPALDRQIASFGATLRPLQAVLGPTVAASPALCPSYEAASATVHGLAPGDFYRQAALGRVRSDLEYVVKDCAPQGSSGPFLVRDVEVTQTDWATFYPAIAP